MKGNLLLSFLKFIAIIYLIILLFDIVFPIFLLGAFIFIAYKAYTKRIKEKKEVKDNRIVVKEKTITETKKDEYKNYIINELYILSEKCNSLDYDKRTELLRTIKETLDEFTTRYDKMIDNSYENCLVLDTEEKIKMEFIERIVKLEEEINVELEKYSKKKDIHHESSKLNNSIGKKLNGFQSNQVSYQIR